MFSKLPRRVINDNFKRLLLSALSLIHSNKLWMCIYRGVKIRPKDSLVFFFSGNLKEIFFISPRGRISAGTSSNMSFISPGGKCRSVADKMERSRLPLNQARGGRPGDAVSFLSKRLFEFYSFLRPGREATRAETWEERVLSPASVHTHSRDPAFFCWGWWWWCNTNCKVLKCLCICVCAFIQSSRTTIPRG